MNIYNKIYKELVGILGLGVYVLNEFRQKDLVLIRELIRDGRISFKRLSEITGLSYTAIRERINRLRRNMLIDIKPLVSPRLYGSVGAVVKVKTHRPYELAEILSKCNRIISLIINNKGLTITLVARTKVELMFTIERLIAHDRYVEEFEIEYGKVPDSILIPLRNHNPLCNPCIAREKYGCGGCFPILRIKNAIK